MSDVAVVLGDTTISWRGNTQKYVTMATFKAKYVALCDAS